MAKAKQSNEKEKVKIEAETADKNVDVTINGTAENAGEPPDRADKKKKQTGDAAAADGATAAETDAKEEKEASKGKEKDEDGEKTAAESLAAEKDRYLRLAAEYDNFRKRTAKERDMTYGNAKADVIGRLLPVYDNLERALKMECSDEAYYKGIEMTMQQLTEILKDLGITPIPAVGEQFDPNLHNAVMRIENPDLGEGIITEECQRGFALGERIIRFATVVVAN